MDNVLLALAACIVIIAMIVALRAHYAFRSYRQRFRWTDDDMQVARRDSVARSHSTVSGKVHEHLAPLLPEFCAEFNPRDARFLGSPVDFVVFDGLDSGELERVVFVEVKTGSSGLSKRERQVRQVVEQGQVGWRELRLPAQEFTALRT